MVHRTLCQQEKVVEQTPKSRKNILLRQDWVRSKIRLIGNGKYYAEHADCYFETRKGLAKGYYLLRLSINAEERPTLCSISIEPVGTNKSMARTFTVSIRSTESEPYLVLPIVVMQRSRVQIKPVNSKGAINATFTAKGQSMRPFQYYQQQKIHFYIF